MHALYLHQDVQYDVATSPTTQKPFCYAFIHLINKSSSTSFTRALLSACNSERDAAVLLGFTQVSWDDLSGQEPQPSSWSKYWDELSANEREAVRLLGYNQKVWDNDSGLEPQPIAFFKSWDELTKCGEGEDVSIPHVSPIFAHIHVCLHIWKKYSSVSDHVVLVYICIFACVKNRKT